MTSLLAQVRLSIVSGQEEANVPAICLRDRKQWQPQRESFFEHFLPWSLWVLFSSTRWWLCSRCSLVALIRPHCPCFSFRWFVYIWPPTYGPVVIVMARSLSKGPANAVLAATKHAQQALLSSTLKMTTETGPLNAVEWCDTEALDANESGVAVCFFPSPAKEPTLMFYR